MYMLAFVQISLKEGISKKIVCQAQALSSIYHFCDLLCLDKDDHFQIIRCSNGKICTTEKLEKLNINYKSFNRVDEFVSKAWDVIQENPQDVVYIRHMVPSLKYIAFLKRIRGRIYTEIPTYPYFYEQLSSSNNKILTSIRILYEAFFWPFIYLNVDMITVIPCRKKARKYKKMSFITNGYCYSNVDNFRFHERNNKNELTLIGVGKIQRYHGYEKIIEAIHNYKGNLKVLFYIVGNGETDYLKRLVDKYALEENVFFTGIKNGNELEALYEKADIGVGTMALEMRRADIDTGIKVIDYYLHGLPVISSGECPSVDAFDLFTPFYTVKKQVDFDSINEWASGFDNQVRSALVHYTKEGFFWENIMRRAINERKS